MYQKFSDVDAVICTAARGIVFKNLEAMDKADYIQSIQSKLLGQIDLVTQGTRYLKPDVSFTLTSGILNDEPIAKGSAAAMVNGGLAAFVYAAALDMPAKQRINIISPALLEASKAQYAEILKGYQVVSGHQVAEAYRKSVFGIHNGQVIKVGY